MYVPIQLTFELDSGRCLCGALGGIGAWSLA
jgi:hypothetical protein